MIPRFASKPFELIATPKRFQSALMEEYEEMIFLTVDEPAEADRDYGEKVVQGISAPGRSRPQLGYAPISSQLMELAYEELTPLVSAWAGRDLQPSWGYGIRSYGPGSKLHVHRDRVDTHVISCIIHVDDRSDSSWALDFVDHDAAHHEVRFSRGQTLFYESLCPHARTKPFEGEYYRNMYLHWRPVDWDPSPYQDLRCKFNSIEDAQQHCIELAEDSLLETIPNEWREWLTLNHSRGCDHQGMIKKAMADSNTLSEAAISSFLRQLKQKEGHLIKDLSQTKPHESRLIRPAQNQSMGNPTPLEWFEAPITRSEHTPRAWKLDSQLAQVYELPDFLSTEECEQLIRSINQSLVPSSVTQGNDSYRTSRTCHLASSSAELAAQLDSRLSNLFGVDPRFSEPLQGQRYSPGEYFKEHTDYFTPGTKEYEEHAKVGGQRTWTVMIYLNTVHGGGQTWFKRLDRRYTPIQGFALAWNNLMADGNPNPFTLHEAMPVTEGEKWVITKWLRSEPGRNG